MRFEGSSTESETKTGATWTNGCGIDIGDTVCGARFPIVTTAGVAAAGETPVGSLFILEAPSRSAIDRFTASDPYHLNNVWQAVEVHYYNKKR